MKYNVWMRMLFGLILLPFGVTTLMFAGNPTIRWLYKDMWKIVLR